jgi:hypothetical protein
MLLVTKDGIFKKVQLDPDKLDGDEEYQIIA